MSKLNQEELLGQVDTWLICCKHDGIKVYGSCKKCPCIEICKQAEQQIREMIQKKLKLEITQEWIEKKANKMIEIVLTGKNVKDFIRSFIKELQEKIK